MADYSTPLGKFEQQRRQAKQREIQWLLTFDEWWLIWQESGHWEQRGKRAGQYVMSRNGDVGPYSISNVAICRFEDNIRDARKNGRIPSTLGTGRGWTYRKGARRPYQVVVADHYIGSFFTQLEAEQAYQTASKNFARASLATPRNSFAEV